jgi:hypothetical protein
LFENGVISTLNANEFKFLNYVRLKKVGMPIYCTRNKIKIGRNKNYRIAPHFKLCNLFQIKSGVRDTDEPLCNAGS